MADNILGLLFVTSSSRGRNVFRYPPDPFSPHTRLTQPIYPSATFTASETLRSRRRRTISLFDQDDPTGNESGRRSNGTSAKGSNVRLSRMLSGDTPRTRGSLTGAVEDGSSGGVGGGDIEEEEEEEEDSDTSMSSGEEPEYTWTASTKAKRPSVEPAPTVPGPIPSTTRSSIVNTTGNGSARISGDANSGMVTFDTSHRGSKSSAQDPRTQMSPAVPTSTLANGTTSKVQSKGNGHDRSDGHQGHDKFIESQYNYALSYSLDFLGDMLTPPPAARNRKFEIGVDELVFIGYPVSVGPDGKWAFLPDEDEADVRPTARGRRREPQGLGQSHLGTVMETKEGTSPETDHSSPKTQSRPTISTTEGDAKASGGVKRDGSDDGPPTLNMFNLVLIMDKPDPQVSSDSAEGLAPNTLADEVYREIIFKWTAAAFSLQVQENYIAKEAWEMAKLRDKGINESIPILDCCRMLYERSSLDRALNQLFAAIYQYQTRPSNPLYASLPTTITVSLANLPISMVLSPRQVDPDEAWAHWGEIDDISEASSEDSEIGLGEQIRFKDLRVEPWQTLLLIDDDVVEQAQEISRSLVGLGIRMGDYDQDGSKEGSNGDSTVRRGSKEEEDEGNLMKALIETCDVSKPLIEIAHILRVDLDGIVIPLARELVQNKKAILVDVMNPRLRTVVMPTTISEHGSTIYDHASRFGKRFPELPPLPTFLASISDSAVQFRELLPKEEVSNSALRQTYMDAMVWLLKQDLVVQVRIRARVFARPEVKETAWRKLYARRRAKWVKRFKRRKESTVSRATVTSTTEADDLETPRAGVMTATGAEEIDPLDTTTTTTTTATTSMADVSLLDYDPDLEMDSDNDNEDSADASDHIEKHGMVFSEDSEEPPEVPTFEGSFIFRPARAQKDEARWLRVIREGADEVWASKFDLCVQHFDGVATFEEISYRTGLQKRELERILTFYKDDIVTFLHP